MDKAVVVTTPELHSIYIEGYGNMLHTLRYTAGKTPAVTQDATLDMIYEHKKA